MQGDNSWLKIDTVYHGNINTDSISLVFGGCAEVFIQDSTINYIIGLRYPNDPTKLSTGMCVTDVLILALGTVNVSPINNLSSRKRTVLGRRTELKLEEFEKRLEKWL